MSMSPKPVELRVVEGNRGKRRIPAVPKSTPLTEHPPDSLDREGRAEWRRITGAWSRQGVLKETDRAALLAYCHVWSAYIAAWRQGVPPSRALMAHFTQLITRLGLSPVDRARIDLGKDTGGKAEDIEELLTGSRGRSR